MKCVNASQAAKIIGISDRTIRRWLKPDKRGRVKLASTRTETGQLAIAVSDVEQLRLEVEQERTQFDIPTRAYDAYKTGMSRPDTTTHVIGHDIDTLTTRLTQLEHQLPELTVLTRELGKLQARCDVQTARIDELERRVNDLEASEYPVSTPPVDETPKVATPQIVTTEPSSGTLSASEFAKSIDLEYTILEGIMRHGIKGKKQPEREYLEKTEIPHPKTGKMQKYFTLEEQRKAKELLRRHGKIK